MTEKRFKVDKGQICDVVYDREKLDVVCRTITVGDDAEHCCNVLNALHEENEQLSKDKQLAEVELMTYKQRVKDELEMRYCLSNHKPVFEFMAKELDITLEGNVE